MKVGQTHSKLLTVPDLIVLGNIVYGFMHDKFLILGKTVTEADACANESYQVSLTGAAHHKLCEELQLLTRSESVKIGRAHV